MFLLTRQAGGRASCLPTAQMAELRSAATTAQTNSVPGDASRVDAVLGHQQRRQRTTVACCVIGDEVLSGKIHDRNSHTLAKTVFDWGAVLTTVRVIPDDVETIATTVKDLSALNDFVFTSGGIGPTHDDVTYDAIAKAFDVSMQVDAETVARMEQFYASKTPPVKMTPARLRMATLPSGCSVLRTDGLWVPLVHLHNVLVLPGVPSLFERMMHRCRDVVGIAPRKARQLIYTRRSEGDIAATLSAAAAANPSVDIGSYPTFDSPHYSVKVTFDGDDAEVVQHVAAEVMTNIDGFQQLPDGVTDHMNKDAE